MAFGNASRFRQYQQMSSAAMICDASAHRQISMLFDGALQKLATAVSGIERNEPAIKIGAINGALAIVEYLRMTLDKERGADVAHNLDMLYEYCMRRLMQANAASDAEALREVSRLLRTVKSGWDEMDLRHVA
jgi:flagellar protein FliS